MVHIVIDLEMNPVKRDLKSVRQFLLDEVIEFGAVKLDENYQPISEFQSYVKPQYGEINKHITQLTGITNETVADKNVFADEFKNFFDWIGTWDMTLYSWSPSDIKQLKAECAYKIKNFNSERLERQWIDLQKVFDDKIGLHSNLALKHAVGAVDFHSKSFENVSHEVWARLILFNCCSAITALAVPEKPRNAKYERYQVNYTMAIKNVHTFLRQKETESPIAIMVILERHVCPVRPERNFERRHRYQTPLKFGYRH